MNERERAEQLARAIDELIHGTTRPGPAHFDDHELQSLVQVAQARLGASKSVVSTDHEAAVWEQLIARLEGRPRPRRPAGDDIAADDEMRPTVAARRDMSDSILTLASQHKDDVWRRIQERIKKRRGSRDKPPSSSGGAGGNADPPPMRTRFFPTGNPDIDSLMAVANRPTLRDVTAKTVSTQQRRLHDRMRNDPARLWRDLALYETHSQAPWGRMAVVGAAIVLMIAALAPIPGLSHPAGVEAARYVGQHLGVVETDVTPPSSTPDTVVLPVDVTPQQASARLGLPVSSADTILGLPLTSSRFYAAGLTSDGSGLFVLTYQAADASSAVTIYQEASGQASLAVPPGEATDTSVNGTPATYYEGSWSEAAGAVTWQEAGTQTLVFERDGLRTTVQYKGTEIDMVGLTAAVSMLPAPTS